MVSNQFQAVIAVILKICLQTIRVCDRFNPYQILVSIGCREILSAGPFIINYRG